MIEFIMKYWLEALFGGLLVIMGAWCKSLQAKLKHKQEEQDALKECMKAILHDMLFQLCEKYITLGFVPVDESEDLFNREEVLYKAYHIAVNGNKTGTLIHERFRALPIRTPEQRR